MERRRFMQLSWFGAASSLSYPWLQGRSPARDYSVLHREILKDQGSAWAISKGGKIQGGANLQARGHAFSITKVMCAMLVSKALSDRLLKLDERVSETFPEWANEAGKNRITILQLLQQTSGLESGAAALYRAAPKDLSLAARQVKCINPPGTLFRYGPASWELLGAILDSKLRARRSNLQTFLRSELLQPLGLSAERWRRDARGVPYLSTGAYLNQEEMQRLGVCVLKLLGGQNAQGLKSKALLSCIAPSEANPMFGGGLWRSSPRGTRAIDVEVALQRELSFPWANGLVAPPPLQGMYTMIGSGGKRIYLLPQSQLVLTRQGSGEAWSDAEFFEKSRVWKPLSA